MPTITIDGTGINTANPSTTCSRTTAIALADQESYFVLLQISNDNPTFTVNTFAGNAMTEVLRMAKTGTGTCVLFGYKNTTGSSIAAGATVTFTWTNTGTTNGGGSELTGAKADGVVDPTIADTTGTGQSLSTTPSATTGTPSSSTKDYLSVSGLAGLQGISATGQATPPAGYTAFTEGYNSTRTRTIYAAAKVLTQPVSAETVAWSQTWGASKQWAEVVALFELAAAGITISAPPASLTLSAPTPAPAESAASPPGSVTLGAPAPTVAETANPAAARLDLSAGAAAPAFAPAPGAATVTLGAVGPGLVETATPAAALLTLSAAAPALVSGALIVSAVPASLTLSLAAPRLASSVATPAGTLTFSAATPTVVIPVVVSAPSATLTFSATAPAISSFTLPNLAAVRYFTKPRAHLRTFLSPVAETDELVSPSASVRAH